MPYCDKLKTIFLHIPKTGGTTIRRIFDLQQLHDSNPATVPSPQHFTCAMLRDAIGDTKYDSYYKFAIVRNPWARVVSSYFWRQSLPKNRTVLPFNEFVSNIEQVVSTQRYYGQEFGDHFIPQTEYTVDVDEIFRFEEFASGINCIASRLSLPTQVLPVNKRGPYGDYAQYYSDETSATIANVYRDDIQEFGYEFGK